VQTLIAAVFASTVCAAAGQAVGDLPVTRIDTRSDQQAPQPAPFPITRLENSGLSVDLDAQRAVSLTFADALPVRDVLLLLFRGTRFSIVFDPGVTGMFSGELTDLTLRQALEAVLYPAGLDYDVRARVVRVFPRRPQMRLFEVNQVDVRRAWHRQLTNRPTGGSGVAEELSSSTESDGFRDLDEGVRTLLSPSGRMHIDRSAGVVQVTDFSDRLDQIGLYLETVTLRASRQVRLQAHIIQVQLGAAAGVDWNAVASQAGIKRGTGAGIRIPDLAGLVQAMSEFGTVRLVASPQVLAMNNEPMVLRVGTERAAFTAAEGRSETEEQIDGLTLTVVAQISADGIVQMSVSPAMRDAMLPGRSGASRAVPISVIEADTMMRVQGGDTAVISGLLHEWSDSVPASGFPGMFGGRQLTTGRAEVIILLTPTVVTPGDVPVAGAR
jgi:type II secretory pathway component GspD/PulD (secretin)